MYFLLLLKDVNWVIQFDCPEDTNAYIHRVGRTARYKKGGESLLFLTPSEEEAMLDELKEKNIPINEIQINPTKVRSIQERSAALCARDVDLKQRAQRCFKTYLKSVYFMKNKLIFNVKLLDFESYASSLGLEVSPRLRFFEKDKNIREKMKETRLKSNELESNDELNNESDNKLDSELMNTAEKEADSEDDFMTLKRKLPYGEKEESKDEITNKQFNFVSKKKLRPITKQSLARKLVKRGLAVNKVKKFTDEDDESDNELDANEIEFNLDNAKKKLAKADEKDKRVYREMKKMKLKESKSKLKQSDDKKTEEEIKQTEELIDELPDPDTIYNDEVED